MFTGRLPITKERYKQSFKKLYAYRAWLENKASEHDFSYKNSKSKLFLPQDYLDSIPDEFMEREKGRAEKAIRYDGFYEFLALVEKKSKVR